MSSKARWFMLASATFAVFTAQSVRANDPNSLTEEEKHAGFVLLFNGRDLEGWEPVSDEMELNEGPWKVQDGAIYFPPDEIGSRGLALAQPIPSDFELRFEWKEAPMHNGGLQSQFTISTHGRMTKQGWTGSLVSEYYAAERGVGLRTLDVSILVKFTNGSISQAPNKDARRPAGHWNEARIVYKGPLVEHWLNGEKVIDINLLDGTFANPKNDAWGSLLEQWFIVRSNGFNLEIQNSGVPGWFRGIKLREIR